MIGQTISRYKITAELGRGGMGVVYKAEDLKLKRPVALKFLAPHLLQDEEARKRFQREATAAAGLSHPNICTVYEIGDEAGQTFLAMEFIEGESLDNKIERGPLPLKEALGFTRQVADGLAAAHAKGVVHRDIKPGNLLVTPEGRVKILDFGLALLTEGSKLTQLDGTVGTVAYMSPEQAQGIEVDYRTDIWALGCVLYEMVRGQRPFQGVYDQALVYEIVNQQPEPLTAVRAGVPMELEWIVGKCLVKDREDRYGRAEDMMLDLRTLAEKLKSGGSTVLRTGVAAGASVAVGDGGPRHAATAQGSAGVGVQPGLASQQTAAPVVASGEMVPKRKHRMLQALFAVSTLVALALAFVHFGETPPEAPLRRFAFTPAVGVGTNALSGDTDVAISPNGRHIAFTAADAQGKLWVQDLDQQRPRAIEGTEGAWGPFWSPDSDFIGFAAGGEVKKVSVQGGLASRLCQLPANHFHGGSWSPDGEVIVFSSGDGGAAHSLYQVPARGGTPNLLISPEESEGSSGGPTGRVAWSHFLPSEAGARVLVFTLGAATERSMMVQNVETGQRELLGPGDFPFYSPSGHLVYQPVFSTHDLWALPFSLDTLKATGEAFPISENSRGPTIAADGTLVYLGGIGSGQQLVWLDRSGEKTGEIGPVQEAIGSPALSPDGRLVAVTAMEGSNQDVWVYDITRGVRIRLSTSPEGDFRPVWSPAGDEVAFTSDRAGNLDIFLRQADASGEEKVLAATPHRVLLSDWSRDGKYLLYHLNDPETGADLWYLERNEDGSGWEPHPFLQIPFGERVPRFSPDGRYVAYVSNESGQDEVYVQPFPEGGRKVTVSSNGGAKVRWSRDGKELFYVEGQTLVAVSVSTAGDFSVGEATRLFEHAGLRPGNNYAPYDVSADGQRFILAEPVAEGADAPAPSIRVVQNWFAEFRGHEQD